jgi:predicted signal transduction protein with EAL and GGDEF domain
MWRGDIDVEQLMHNADVAMYAAKTSGKGKVTRFDDWALGYDAGESAAEAAQVVSAGDLGARVVRR